MSGTLSFLSIPAPSGVSWSLRAVTQIHESPFDGTTQTLAMPAARWEVTATWQTLAPAQSRQLEAWIASLRGRAGRFFFGPVHAPRQATGGGSPVVSGAGQTGSSLFTAGWSAGVYVIRAGDYLSYNDTSGRRRLHMATADVVSNGSGQAAIPITPPIRRAGANGAAVNVASPTGVFRLMEDAVPLAVRPPLFGSVTLQMIEALA